MSGTSSPGSSDSEDASDVQRQRRMDKMELVKKFGKTRSEYGVKRPREMNGTSSPGSSNLEEEIGKLLGVPTQGIIEYWKKCFRVENEVLWRKETELDMLKAEVARLKIDALAYQCHGQQTDDEAYKAFKEIKHSAIASKAFVDVKPSATSHSDSPDLDEVIPNLKNESLKTELDMLKAQVATLKIADEGYRCHRQQTGDEASKAFKDIESSDIADAIKEGEAFEKGGHGLLYKCQLYGGDVAIKVPIELNLSREIKAFKDEVLTLRRIRHPNIVILHGACVEKCALVYEFLPNGTLEKRLIEGKGNDSFPWEERVHVAASISTALAYLHVSSPHPIAHADLKPNNILFDAKNICKLGDFGISRFMQQKTTGGTPCHITDKPMGTTPFMDPDFNKGYKKLTCLADQFAFGIILLQLVTGRYDLIKLRKPVSKKMNSFGGKLTDEKIRILSEHGLMDTTWTLNDKSKEVSLKMLSLGLGCSQRRRKDRPDFKKVWAKIKMLDLGLRCSETKRKDRQAEKAVM